MALTIIGERYREADGMMQQGFSMKCLSYSTLCVGLTMKIFYPHLMHMGTDTNRKEHFQPGDVLPVISF
eukprot:7991133-Ditylum_brightwellii.AAC.1